MVKKKVNQEDKQRTNRVTSKRLRKAIGSETRCWTGGQEVRKSRESRKTRGHVAEKQSEGKVQGARTSRRTERITTGGKEVGQAEAPSSKRPYLKTRRRKSKRDSE